jgi:toxin ParE1/3/4
MKVYRLSPAAEADLDDIWAYTAESWSPEQAEIYVSRLFAAFVKIGQNPGLGQKADWIIPGYRRFRCGHHLIFYVTAGADPANVVRILHEKVDVVRHLREKE